MASFLSIARGTWGITSTEVIFVNKYIAIPSLLTQYFWQKNYVLEVDFHSYPHICNYGHNPHEPHIPATTWPSLNPTPRIEVGMIYLSRFVY